jgi:hypothetical protein
LPPPDNVSRRRRTITGIDTRSPPHETVELRRELARFLAQPLSQFRNDTPTTSTGRSITVGAVKWGVYAFFDYDGEPIYVGQTRESLGSRIGRHLTNQRTDAVAMSVLDPFEVRTVKLWPLHQFQNVRGDPKKTPAAREAADHLNALERTVFLQLIEQSDFGAILNEKDPPESIPIEAPRPIEGEIVAAQVRETRQHPDVRIARRAQTIARLAQIIAGRDVQVGLRRALATQADRLAWIANQRFLALGGEAAVDTRAADEPTDHDVTADDLT